MPEKYKKVMHTVKNYGEWVSKYFAEAGDAQSFIDSLGENLSKRFPFKFKLGTYKRAIFLFNQNKHKDSYKKLYEAFKIDSIKLHFNVDYRPN